VKRRKFNSEIIDLRSVNLNVVWCKISRNPKWGFHCITVFNWLPCTLRQWFWIVIYEALVFQVHLYDHKFGLYSELSPWYISPKFVLVLSLYLHVIFSCGHLLRFNAKVLFSFLMGFEVLMEGVLFLQSSEMCLIVCYISTKLHGVILQKIGILTLISYFLQMCYTCDLCCSDWVNYPH